MKKTTNNPHKKFMRIAIALARKGAGKVSPNPMVGCVIVKDGRVIASAYHKSFGGPHAEAIALKKAGKRSDGATLYVTLEPCSYFGKTPACTDAIMASGIREVIAAMADPNPANDGRGFRILRKSGIEVAFGILRKEAETLNKHLIDAMKRRRPFVTLKLAQSIDGKIATRTGDSKWISSDASRAMVQKIRSRNDAIMVGINTVIKDDPLLSIRASRRQPVKIVVDSMLKTSANARILNRKISPGRVIIAATGRASKAKEKLLSARGAEILRLGARGGRVDLRSLMKTLACMGMANVLVEGGGELAGSLFKDRLVDKALFFVGPILVGGRDAPTSVGGSGIERIKDAVRLKDIKLKRIKEDLLVEADVYGNR